MPKMPSESRTHPILSFWVCLGWVAFIFVPWYGIEDGLFSFDWATDGYPLDPDYAPAAFLVAQGKKLWLAPLVLPLLSCSLALTCRKSDPIFVYSLLIGGAVGFCWLIAQGFAIGISGLQFGWLESLLGPLHDRQFGMGYGALILASSFLFMFTQGYAARSAINGDYFVVSAIAGIVVVVSVFVFFPIARMLVTGFIDDDGSYSLLNFVSKFFDDRIWGLSCLVGPGRCGAAWNSLFLAILVGFLTTVLGLVFALTVTRSGFRFKPVAASVDRASNHNATLRDRAGDHTSIRVIWIRNPVHRQFFRHSTKPVDLWCEWSLDRSSPGLHSYFLSGFGWRRRGSQSVDGGSGTNASRQPLAGLPHRFSPLDATWTCQRIFVRFYRKHG